MLELDLSTFHNPHVTPEESSTRKTLTALSLAVVKSRRIIVVTGAGISCSSGIPDFRSSDGLYALVKSRYPTTILKGRDLFSASLFRDPASTKIFYTFIASLKSSIDSAHPSPTHHFIKTLDTKGKLLRSYTQNIDGLEEKAGLIGASAPPTELRGKGKGRSFKAKDVKNVQLHGDIHRVRCTMCSAEYPYSATHSHSFLKGESPPCPECDSRSQARVSRAARSLPVGNLRPAIVLYDEIHPLGEDIGFLSARDASRRPDLLIIMGTSLKVHGLKRLVKDFAQAVRASASSSSKTTKSKSTPPLLGKVIFVNRTPPPTEWNSVIDYWVKGKTDDWVTRCEAEWKRVRPQDWEVQTTLDGPSVLSSGANGISLIHEDEPYVKFKVVKNNQAVPAKGKLAKGNAENIPPSIVDHPELPNPYYSTPKFQHLRSNVSDMPATPSTPSTPGSPVKRRSPSSSSLTADESVEMQSPSDVDDQGGSPKKKTKRTPSLEDTADIKRLLFASHLAIDGDSSMMSLDGEEILPPSPQRPMTRSRSHTAKPAPITA